MWFALQEGEIEGPVIAKKKGEGGEGESGKVRKVKMSNEAPGLFFSTKILSTEL